MIPNGGGGEDGVDVERERIRAVQRRISRTGPFSTVSAARIGNTRGGLAPWGSLRDRVKIFSAGGQSQL